MSKRVVTVAAEDRAADVSALIESSDASYCVVVEKPRGEFLGVVRLRELAAKPEGRIFADLLSCLPEVRLSRRATSFELKARLQKEKLEEAVVLSLSGAYVGLVTRESLGSWNRLQGGRSSKATTRDVAKLEHKVQQQASVLSEVIAQLDEFSYAIAHEMRTPLRAVRGYAVTLQEDHGQRLDETAREYLQRIIRASDRLDRLTLGVIAYREITSVKLSIRKVNTKTVVADALQVALKDHPLLNVTAEGTFPFVHADKDQLTRCISELIGNAVKFAAPSREPKIRIYAEAAEAKGTICVEDNGIGVRTENGSRIFQLFEQVDGSRADMGHGVGLAIVRKAIERMGGKVKVRSDGKSGSCFCLTLPALQKISKSKATALVGTRMR